MASFQVAVAALWPHEGGYVNHPADPGGPTNFGITLATLRATLGPEADFDHDGDVDAEDVKLLPRERAEIIYRERYWDRPGLGQLLDQRIATKVFDLGVNAGPPAAIILLQRAVNWLIPAGAPKLQEDGALGPRTVAAVNASDPELVLRAFITEQKLFYLRCIEKDPKKEAFKRNWIARANWIPAGGGVA